MNRLRDDLLKNQIIWNINAGIKSNKIVKRYKYWVSQYEKRITLDLDLPRLPLRPKILFIGTDERQDKSGFFQALCEACSYVIPFTTFEGEWGQYKTGTPCRQERNYERLSDILSSCDTEIDCLLMQAWGASFYAEDINALKEQYGFKVINIDLDSRLVFKKTPYIGRQNPGILGLARCVDLVLVSTREVVDWYRKEGIAAIYFPLASSSKFYYPIEGVERIYDVGFIGSNYGLRSDEVRYFQKHGIVVEARGPGWPRGPIAFEENNFFFNQCKIVLGMGNISYCKNFYNPKLRDYDAPMSGSVYITNRTSELEFDFVENKEIILFDIWDEAVDKIKELLSNPERMNRIREAAYTAAKERHSYEDRFKNLFEMLSGD